MILINSDVGIEWMNEMNGNQIFFTEKKSFFPVENDPFMINIINIMIKSLEERTVLLFKLRKRHKKIDDDDYYYSMTFVWCFSSDKNGKRRKKINKKWSF